MWFDAIAAVERTIQIQTIIRRNVADWHKADMPVSSANVRFGGLAQPIDATQALNLSAGVSNQQTNGVLVRSTLPRTLRIAKVNVDVGRQRKSPMISKLRCRSLTDGDEILDLPPSIAIRVAQNPQL
jgi:hypothetical protein